MSTDISTRSASAAHLRRIITFFTPTIPYLTHTELTALQTRHVPHLLDARTPEEFQLGTLPNAQHLSTLSTALSDVPVSTPVVLFCTVGLRSGCYAARLAGQGWMVYNYSVVEHLWGNEALVRPDGAHWEGTVHVYSKRYERCFPPGMRTASFQGLSVLYNVLPVVPSFIFAALVWVWWLVSRRCVRPFVPVFGPGDGDVGERT